METVKKELFDSYDGKGIAAQYSRYAERVSKDIKGNDLELTVSAGRVTQVGGKPVGADAYTKTETGTLLDGKADKAVPGATGNLAALNGTGNLADSGIPGGTAAEGTSSLVITNTTANNATTTTYGWGAWVKKSYKVPDEILTIDGRNYPTVKIGNQKWMTENLDYQWSGLPIGLTDPLHPRYPAAWYYNNAPATYGENGNKYGLLYNGYAAMYLNANLEELGIPDGWHVPELSDFNTLCTAIGIDPNTAGVSTAKIRSTSGWSQGNGTNELRFDAVPSGRRNTNYMNLFTDVGQIVLYMTATEREEFNTDIWTVQLGTNIIYRDTMEKVGAGAIRLVKDA